MKDFNRLEDFFKKMRYLVDSLNEEDLGLVVKFAFRYVFCNDDKGLSEDEDFINSNNAVFMTFVALKPYLDDFPPFADD